MRQYFGFGIANTRKRELLTSLRLRQGVQPARRSAMQAREAESSSHSAPSSWPRGFSLSVACSLLVAFDLGQLQAAELDHAQSMGQMRGKEEHVGIWQRYPFLGVPLVKEGPKVDGIVDTREWASSARVSYMVDYNKGMAVRDKTEIYVCYTPTHFYIGFQFERPQNARAPSLQDLFEILFDWSHGHAKYGNI